MRGVYRADANRVQPYCRLAINAMKRTPSHNWAQRPIRFAGADEFSDTLGLPAGRFGIRYLASGPDPARLSGRIAYYSRFHRFGKAGAE